MIARRHERGAWIVRVIGPWNDWKRAIWRDVYRLQGWWFRNGWAAVIAVAVLALATATVAKVATIYAPNPHVPFISASAVRG